LGRRGEKELGAEAGMRGMEYGGFMGRNNFKTFEASLDSMLVREFLALMRLAAEAHPASIRILGHPQIEIAVRIRTASIDGGRVSR
jgi:hypothetical protein